MTSNQSTVLESYPAPRTYRGVARRELILKVASTRFLAQGYAGVSVDEIVKEVGGSKTNVYRQFGGKEGLFIAVVDVLSADFLRDYKVIDLTGKTAAQGLKILAKALLGILLQERHLAFQRLIIAESGRFPALGRVWLESGPQQSRLVISRFIQEQQRNARFRPADAMRAATFFHDMITFNPTHMAMLGVGLSAKELDHFIDDAIEAFLHGYSA